MFKLIIPSMELYDEVNNEFRYTKEYTLMLQHSLVALSKWESRWCKPFLTKGAKTVEETIDYIRCMTVTQNVDPIAYSYITQKEINAVMQYIDHPMSATVINQEKSTTNNQVITSELIYYWMIAMNIPFECQKWHLNRLLMLINVCNIENAPKKKYSQREIMSKNAALNAARKKKLNTNG